MRNDEYTFEIWQGGMMVAEVTAPDLESARREALHYAITYAQDGPVEIKGAHVAALMPPPHSP